MSDEDIGEDEDLGSDLPKGAMAEFVRSMNPEQRAMWTPIRRAWRYETRRALLASGKSNRDSLHDAINRAQGKITPSHIEKLISTAIEKGDTRALETLSKMAGIDLSDRPAQAAGEGAKVIIIRPHPLLLNGAEEADIQRQIAAHEGGNL